MTRRISQFVIASAFAAAVTVMGGALLSPAQAAPIYPTDLSQRLQAAAELTSFWGRAYPHGYAYRGDRCIRYTKVRTSHGWRTKRVRVC